MSSRTLRSYAGSQNLKDCLASLFMLETLQPSPEIYIISPWISDSPIIENTINRYSDLFPFINSNHIRLSDIISMIAWKGSQIRLICNPDHYPTQNFLSMVGKSVEYNILTDIHEKGLLTNNFYLHGSMNFTYSGINLNSECIRITTDTSEISKNLLEMRLMWREKHE